MKLTLCLFLSSFSVCFGQNYQFTNGQWFNGSGFDRTNWYITRGILTHTAPAKIDSVIDLKNAYVVPPYGEAHNHNVAAGINFDGINRKYLSNGIFYVKNPNSLIEDKPELIRNKQILTPKTIDAVFSNGGLTATKGHPFRFFEGTAKGENNFYHYIDSEEDIKKKWSMILDNKPDFIKTYLLFSEEFEKRKNDPKYDGLRGLDPKLLALIVKEAHMVALRVSTHIETSADFRQAILAGVDEINHMPGFRGNPMRGVKASKGDFATFLITAEDARVAAANGTVVVTTIGDTKSLPFFLKVRKMANRLHQQNLTVLKEANVKIALGSDSYEKNSLIEVKYLSTLGVFTNLELLKMLCETTPLTIFPDRKISFLKDGCEASFVVLKADPLRDIKNVKQIKLAVKQGVILKLDQ